MLDEAGTALQVRSGELAIRLPDGSERHFSPRKHGLQHVVLAVSASLTTDALRWLAAEDVMVTVCGRGGEAVGLFGYRPEADMTAAALAARRGQWRALLDRGRSFEAARAIIKSKFENSADTVASQAFVGRLDACNAVTETLIVEGDHALAYWRALGPSFTLEFSDAVPAVWTRFEARASVTLKSKRRTNRHASTPANAILNYTYGATLNRIIRELLARDLDPAFGFLHAPKHGRASLAYYVLEILRPAIDRAVIGYAKANIFAKRDFPIIEQTVRCGRDVARDLLKVAREQDARGAVELIVKLIGT
jgi:CRISPR-associated protein Cas1